MKAKIILFEDDANVRESVFEILVNSGYEVTVLESDSDFYSNIISNKPDLVLSDIMMPGKSGFDVFKEIKKNEETHNIPFIFLTAKSEYTDIRFGMSLGADDYILKPFKAKDLLRSIELRLAKARLVKERMHSFSSSIALHVPHELRTPLIALLGYSDLIIEDYDNLSDNDILDYTKIIKRSSHRLHRIIEKFILYAEILSSEFNDNTNERFISKERVDISTFIKLSSLNTATLFKRQNDLKIKLEPYECRVTEESISILISQILENAFKYSNPGTKVEVIGKKMNASYLISVKDNGSGMTKDEITKIFALQQFKRNMFNQSGNGLGLAIAKKISSYINSNLDIISKPGEGTTVSLELKGK